jgi:putative aldouronate transport system permease protein
VFIFPGIMLLILFAYVPMFGILIAFKDYRIHLGVLGSPWNALANFEFFKDSFFWFTAKNTILLTFFRLLVTFPAPIILALMINEVHHSKAKKLIQSATYLPHFVSWVVVAYLFNSMLALDTGVVNNLLQALGFKQFYFMGTLSFFRPLIIFANLWKGVGWSTIIYLAALSAVNPELHEAACIDGAGKMARIWYINIPGILPTISILLILSMPSLLSAGYESILPFVNAANMEVSSVLDVYVVRLGLSQAQYGKATAIGLTVSVLSLVIVFMSNYIAKKLDQTTLL